MIATTRIAVGAVLAHVVALLTALMKWDDLGSMSLDARIAGAVIITLGVMVTAALFFFDFSRRLTKKRRLKRAVITSLPIAVFAVVLFELAAVYHSILIIDDGSCTASRSTWQCIELRPCPHPTDLDWNLSVRDRHQNIGAEWSPGFWSNVNAGTWTIRHETPYELTVRLTGFKSPGRFGVSYRLAGLPDRLRNQVSEINPDSPNSVRAMRVIRSEELRWFHWCFRLIGGMVWLVGCFLLYFSSLWVPVLHPKAPRDTRTQEQS